MDNKERTNMQKTRAKKMRFVGYLCIQHYPRRICVGCTSACAERVYVDAEEGADDA